MSGPILIVGANACGQATASGLREGGFDGEIVLVGDEKVAPYERPILSKEYLQGTRELERSFLRPGAWYEEQEIDARFGTRVEAVDMASKTATLDGGDRIGWSQLMLATGLRNRTLDVPGSGSSGIHYLRDVADADGIKGDLEASRRAVVVGMGFIGAEVAASLRTVGIEVTVVEPLETALHRVLGAEFGGVIEGLHAEHGIDMRFGEGVSAFESNPDGSVAAVVTSSGDSIPCDFAVVGIGTVPNTELAEAAGIDCENGILVDAQLRTSAPGVWAGGDVVNHDHPIFGRMRVEHFDNAIKMGATAAANMLGSASIFDDPHWFWSDQYDCSIQMAGHAPEPDEVVIRGEVGSRDFIAFFLVGGVLRQVLGINRPRDVRRSLGLIRGQVSPDPGALSDPDTDLRSLSD